MPKPSPILGHMPMNIKFRIFERTDWSSKLSLRQCCSEFQEIVDSTETRHRKLVLVLEDIFAKIQLFSDDCHQEVELSHGNNGLFVKTGDSNRVCRTHDMVGAVVARFVRIWRNPGVTVEELVLNTQGDVQNGLIGSVQQDINRQLSVKKLEIQLAPDEKYLLKVLSILRPGTLREINIRNNAMSETMNLDAVAELEQWKRAEKLSITGISVDLPFDKWDHFRDVDIELNTCSEEHVQRAVEKYRSWGSWRTCVLRSENTDWDSIHTFLDRFERREDGWERERLVTVHGEDVILRYSRSQKRVEHNWVFAVLGTVLVLSALVVLSVRSGSRPAVTSSFGGESVRLTERHVTESPSADGEVIKDTIDPANLRRNLRAMTKKPHIAGTENNYEVAEFIRQQLVDQGLDNVHFNEYDVLLSYPDWNTPNTIEILGANGETVFRTSGRSPSIIKEEQNDASAEIQWFAYSANGVVEGDIVYVNKATKEDFEHLASLGIDLEGKIMLARHSGVYRGNIARMAVKKGAAGCLIYSDPIQVAKWGTHPNQTYQNTDKMPPNAVQRGSLFVGSGDPRTPAFPSLKGLYKEKDEDQLLKEKRIPTIPVLPIPYSAAQVLFENMRGYAVASDFQGNLNVTYRYGPGLVNNQRIRMTVNARNEERTIRNVLGYIEGQSQELLILSNHYDAWTYGAIDPNSGTSVLLEVSRALKAYQNATGWVPARSILFAHWDAEEYGFIGSSEFSEEFRVQLMSRAVAVVNMDLIGGNQTLVGVANPIIANVLREAAANAPHPNEAERKEGRMTMYDSWKTFWPPKGNRSHPNFLLPAGGSDHASFFDYLGVPIITFITSSLDAPVNYPLYHTIYETPYLVENILDPKFEMHRTVAHMFIDMALKFSESDVLPYDLREFIRDVEKEYLPKIANKLTRIWESENIEKHLKSPMKQFELLKKSVKDLSAKIDKRSFGSTGSLSFIQRIEENRRLLEFERCFINPQGGPGSPEARHVLYHPSAEDLYRGGVMIQVHSLISKMVHSSDEKTLEVLSKRLSIEIALVNVAFICARHSLDRLPTA